MSIIKTSDVETYQETDPATGNTVAYAQRYAIDHSKIGNPVQLTTSYLNATGSSALLLSNGAFEVTYYVNDPNAAPDVFGQPIYDVATELVSADNRILSNLVLGNSNPSASYYGEPSSSLDKLVGLSGGAYVFLETDTKVYTDAYVVRTSVNFVSGTGVSKSTTLFVNATEYGPYPELVLSNPTLQRNTNDTFTVTYQGQYSPPDPSFPDVLPGPAGTETVTQTYRDDGTLQQSRVAGFDGSISYSQFNAAGKLTSTLLQPGNGSNQFATYDPNTGVETGAFIRNADGSRTESNFAVTGKPYTQQTASYDGSGKVVDLTRAYANGVTALSQHNKSDGSGTVDTFDTSGRETTKIVSMADGSKTVVNSTYAGTSTTPSRTQLFDYASGNKLLSIDTTNANGSHVQVAVTSGVMLTSTTGVPDTFTSAATGGDTFVFKPDFGQDLLTNFHAGSGANHDIADFTAFHVQLGSAQSQSDYLAQHLKQVGTAAVLTIAPNEVLTLKNTLVASLSRDNVLV